MLTDFKILSPRERYMHVTKSKPHPATRCYTIPFENLKRRPVCTIIY